MRAGRRAAMAAYSSRRPVHRQGPTGTAVRPAGISARHERQFPSSRAHPLTDSPAAATILIVDDDRRLRTGLATYLRKHGYTVATAAQAGGGIRPLTPPSFGRVFSQLRDAA